jgi:hypothetical protein
MAHQVPVDQRIHKAWIKLIKHILKKSSAGTKRKALFHATDEIISFVFKVMRAAAIESTTDCFAMTPPSEPDNEEHLDKYLTENLGVILGFITDLVVCNIFSQGDRIRFWYIREHIRTLNQNGQGEVPGPAKALRKHILKRPAKYTELLRKRKVKRYELQLINLLKDAYTAKKEAQTAKAVDENILGLLGGIVQKGPATSDPRRILTNIRFDVGIPRSLEVEDKDGNPVDPSQHVFDRTTYLHMCDGLFGSLEEVYTLSGPVMIEDIRAKATEHWDTIQDLGLKNKADLISEGADFRGLEYLGPDNWGVLISGSHNNFTEMG